MVIEPDTLPEGEIIANREANKGSPHKAWLLWLAHADPWLHSACKLEDLVSYIVWADSVCTEVVRQLMDRQY